MDLTATCDFDFFTELSAEPQLGAVPLHREAVQADLADLVEEAFVGAVLADEISEDSPGLQIEVSPAWDQEPRAEAVDVTIARQGGEGQVARRFETGLWMRRAQARAWALAAEGLLPEGAQSYVHLLAEARDNADIRLPHLLPPAITEQSLENLGVQSLGSGDLCPERPVLVNARMLEEIVGHAEESGARETGGGTLGKMIRLDRPLPGTRTRVVTVLSTAIVDTRHVGDVARLTFDPTALHHAAEVAALRGKGETVLTAFHTHGWGTECGRCNQNSECALPSASHVSLDDYRVLESLFPSKATLMPIAGRKFGAPGNRPVLEIHAWRGGRMTPIPWRTYSD